jgi:type II secretory pathway pseudopilin PulG
VSHMHEAPRAMGRNKPYHGLTLVELLVVVGVISVITAIILPSVKTILTDRKTSQTAIIVKNFFEAARARAIGKNKTVAVVLERVSSRVDPASGPSFTSATAQTVPTAALASQPPDFNFIPYNACIRMSVAEEPLPVTDTMLPTSISIQARAPSDGFSPSIPTSGAYSGMDSLLDADQIAGISEVRIFSVTPGFTGFNVSSLLGEYLVTGSQISFGNSKRRFTIVSPRNPAAHISHAAATGQIWFSVMNEEGLEGLGERALEPPEPLVAGQISSAFKIYPRPKPIYSEMVQLPRGMCIDLSLSGFSNDSLRNSTAASPNKQRVYDPVLTPNPTPMSDYRVRFASDWVSNQPIPLLPNQLRPVYIAFGPDGNLSYVWANERGIPGGSGYLGNLTRIDATQDIFLHIGKIDQVVMPVDPDPAVLGRNKFAFDALNASGVKQNLSDLNSYVVRLSPKSGAITASPAVSIDTQIGILGLNPNDLSLGDLIELSRRGTYSTNVTSQ